MTLPALTPYEHALATVTDAGTSLLLDAVAKPHCCVVCTEVVPVHRGTNRYCSNFCGEAEDGWHGEVGECE